MLLLGSPAVVSPVFSPVLPVIPLACAASAETCPPGIPDSGCDSFIGSLPTKAVVEDDAAPIVSATLPLLFSM